MKMVEKTLDLLEVILQRGGEVSLSELAEVTGLHISTARRFTSTLVKRGYLYQKNRGGDYSFGLKFLQFSDIVNAAINIKDLAQPFQKQLSDEISQSIALAILNGLVATDISVVSPENNFNRVVPYVMSSIPLHCSSSGKIFLSEMPDKKIEQLAKTLDLKAYTEKTVTDWKVLKTHIEKVKHDGVAFDNEEFISGVRSIAAPIKDETGKVLATFSVVTPSSLLTSLFSIDELVSIIKKHSLQASRSFGYKGN